MKARLEFNLPEEKCEFNIASRSMEWALTVWDIDQKLREWLKYGAEFKRSVDALEHLRSYIHELLDERGISLDDIL